MGKSGTLVTPSWEWLVANAVHVKDFLWMLITWKNQLGSGLIAVQALCKAHGDHPGANHTKSSPWRPGLACKLPC